ncbi:MAG: adenylosuccinate synthetase [Evtepia gabavorous]
MPANAKAYVDFISQEIQTPIKMVSTGPKRHEIALHP